MLDLMQCRVCDRTDFRLVVDLGNQPRANHFLTQEEVGTEPIYPLRLVYCTACQTAQLDHTIKKEIVNSEHSYLSGVTRSLREHFETVARDVDERYFSRHKKKAMLDIGSNDGTGLKAYQKLGYRVLGVEASSQLVAIANRENALTQHAFFNLQYAQELNQRFDVINAAGVFFHLEELHSVTQGIHHLLKRDGVFVVQAMYMKCIMENGAFDQIYHEHLLYYTFKTLDTLLKRHNLELFDAYLSEIHGGSIIAHAGHRGTRTKTMRLRQLIAQEEALDVNAFATYAAFASKLPDMKEENLAYLRQQKALGKRIYGMGAPVKGNTLLNYFGIDTQLLDCLVEKNPLRKGRYSPGMHIPIYMEEEMPPPDIYYVLAWNFKREILERNRDLIAQGTEFYFPVDPDRQRIFA